MRTRTYEKQGPALLLILLLCELQVQANDSAGYWDIGKMSYTASGVPFNISSDTHTAKAVERRGRRRKDVLVRIQPRQQPAQLAMPHGGAAGGRAPAEPAKAATKKAAGAKAKKPLADPKEFVATKASGCQLHEAAAAAADAAAASRGAKGSADNDGGPARGSREYIKDAFLEEGILPEVCMQSLSAQTARLVHGVSLLCRCSLRKLACPKISERHMHAMSACIVFIVVSG